MSLGHLRGDNHRVFQESVTWASRAAPCASGPALQLISVCAPLPPDHARSHHAAKITSRCVLEELAKRVTKTRKRTHQLDHDRSVEACKTTGRLSSRDAVSTVKPKCERWKHSDSRTELGSGPQAPAKREFCSTYRGCHPLSC